MTIKFRCPHCQASIRVAGSAAGKRGRCPQCAAKIDIPQQSEQSAQPGAPAETPPVHFDAVDEEAIQFDPAPAPSQDDTLSPMPALGRTTDPLLPAFAPPDAPLRRPRKRKKGPPVVPLIFAAVLVVTVTCLVIYYRQGLTGTLTGVIVPDAEMDRGLIGRAETSAGAAAFERIRRDLQDAPVKLLDAQGLYTITLSGVRSGIEVTATLTGKGQCVRVDLGQNSGLSDYVADHAAELNAVKAANLKKYAREFVDVWTKAIESGKRDAAALEKFRTHLAVASMVSGFGYHVAAWDGRRTYPCLSVKSGEMFFIVPNGTTQFELRGVDVGDGITFPGAYDVRISGSPPPQPEAKPEPPTEPPTETPDDTNAPPTEPPKNE